MDSDSYNGDSLFPIVASQSQLQDVARLRALMLPSLSMLIRYLNVSTRQDYLVKRIHGEEEGGSLDCTCTYRLIVTIKSCEGRERVGEGEGERKTYFLSYRFG